MEAAAMIFIGRAAKDRTSIYVALALCILAIVSPIYAQVEPPSLLRMVSDANSCPEEPTLKAAEGGGTFALGTKSQTRVPYGVHFSFLHKVAAADAVFLELRIERQEPVRLSGPLAGKATCYEATLPELPQGRAITLVETIVRAPSQQKRENASKAMDKLRETFLNQLYAQRWEKAAVEHRLPEAIGADFGLLADTTALSGLALVTFADQKVVPLADTLQRLLVDRADDLIGIPDTIAKGQSLLQALDKAADGGGVCSVEKTPSVASARIELDRLRQRLAALRSVSTGEELIALYDRKVLPLKIDNPDDVATWIRQACARTDPSPQLETLALQQAATVRSLSRDPLTPFNQLIAAAREALRNSYEIAAVDAFGGFTTTLQRFGQIDIVNAYVFDREEVRLLATFSFYPLRRRYGAEREPQSFGDHLVVTVGYSVATTVKKAGATTDDGGMFTAGGGLRVNQTLGFGAGKAFIGGDSHWYVNMSFDLGSIPGLENAFARK
jgi:hypothetical protein